VAQETAGMSPKLPNLAGLHLPHRTSILSQNTFSYPYKSVKSVSSVFYILIIFPHPRSICEYTGGARLLIHEGIEVPEDKNK